jgi:hypothetical protein
MFSSSAHLKKKAFRKNFESGGRGKKSSSKLKNVYGASSFSKKKHRTKINN